MASCKLSNPWQHGTALLSYFQQEIEARSLGVCAVVNDDVDGAELREILEAMLAKEQPLLVLQDEKLENESCEPTTSHNSSKRGFDVSQ